MIGGHLLLAPDGTLWKFDPHGPGGSLTFMRFAPGDDWKTISGSAGEGFALKEDGTLWHWLSPRSPGSSTSTFYPPVQLGTDSDWAQVAADWNCALLRKKNGTIWFIGGEFRNSNDGLVPLQPGMMPMQVGTSDDWTDIASALLRHFALKRDGTLWHWGNAIYRGPYEKEPKPFGADHDWQSITSSGFHFFAFKKDHSLWVGGANVHVVITDVVKAGPSSDIYRVNADTDWVRVSSGGNAMVAQKSDGSWWASGENHYASLGFRHWFGESKHVSHPQRIPISLDPWAWSVDENTTLLLTRDGRFYYMGKKPGTSKTPSSIATTESAINQWIRRKGLGLPALFARPGEEWSRTPVRIGELPASVVANLNTTGSAMNQKAAGSEKADRRVP